ncbi:tetratricopeptide repeat protein [Agrococcus carbonis]|uniref:Tetratrico peptide repeat-containing protein n=1 Tax=Agrococcus carbonis TaxID=684552 RepID=A0A1H1RT40_9MICO|nr:tetratricopeptide repeat protein [Agrococcus carbonis]SDS38850.1 Tetratrico peptide repeat-containing protein [Agrococcus carbonis]
MTADWDARVDAVYDDESLGDDARVARIDALAESAPHPAIGLFERAGALDSAGREAEAEPLYRAAVAAGLADADPVREAYRRIQHASTLRNLGRVDEAIAMLESAGASPEVGAAREAFLALALHSAGRHDEALRVALEALAPTLPLYRRAVLAYAAELTHPTA